MKLFPWETGSPEYADDATDMVPLRPELQRDASGMYPGQQHPLDLPDFLNRATSPPATNRRS